MGPQHERRPLGHVERLVGEYGQARECHTRRWPFALARQLPSHRSSTVCIGGLGSRPALCPGRAQPPHWMAVWRTGPARSRGGGAACPRVGTGRTVPRRAPGRPGPGARAVHAGHGRSGSGRACRPDGHRAARRAQRWPDTGWSRSRHRARSPRRPPSQRAAPPAAARGWSDAHSSSCRRQLMSAALDRADPTRDP